MYDSFATPQTVAHQDPLSVGFPRQEYWPRLPFPSPEDLPNPGILYWQSDSLLLSHQLFWEVIGTPSYYRYYSSETGFSMFGLVFAGF